MQQMSFLPPAPRNPLVPGPGLALVLWKMLASGHTVDHEGFIQETGSWRLAAYVNELRRLGWNVKSRDVWRPTASNPHRYIAAYWLDDEALLYGR